MKSRQFFMLLIENMRNISLVYFVSCEWELPSGVFYRTCILHVCTTSSYSFISSSRRNLLFRVHFSFQMDHDMKWKLFACRRSKIQFFASLMNHHNQNQRFSCIINNISSLIVHYCNCFVPIGTHFVRSLHLRMPFSCGRIKKYLCYTFHPFV
jgi:hypothetical protein